MADFDFKVSGNERFDIELTDNIEIELELAGKVDFEFEAMTTDIIGGEEYVGDYEVTPTNKDVVVDTDGKVLSEDIVVKAVPTYTVTNTAGGTTFIIG